MRTVRKGHRASGSGLASPRRSSPRIQSWLRADNRGALNPMQKNQKTNVAVPVANSIEVAAERLGISRSGLYNLISIGQIKAIKIGGRRLIPESELQSIVA